MTGAELRVHYLNLGYSRRGFSKAIGVPEQSIRRFENGEPISPRYAKRLADHLGTTVVDLLGLNGNDEPNPVRAA